MMRQNLRSELAGLAGHLAPRQGYNRTALASVRILKSEEMLKDVPVLYRPGAVFVLRGSKRGMLEGEVYLYDEDHYLAVSVPVPFRMESVANRKDPLLAIYVEFDLALAAEIAAMIEARQATPSGSRARSLMSSPMEPAIEDTLFRLLKALGDPVEAGILGDAILRELHYRILVGPQGGAMMAALQQDGASARIVRSLASLRETYRSEIAVSALASNAGMSVPSYHTHFKALTGSSPMQYVKAMRLHEARLMMAREDMGVASVAISVGYASPAQFSRDFKRHFGRTASEEVKWVRRHLGEFVLER
jgi:AraC-like DNA-binding protein